MLQSNLTYFNWRKNIPKIQPQKKHPKPKQNQKQPTNQTKANKTKTKHINRKKAAQKTNPKAKLNNLKLNIIK